MHKLSCPKCHKALTIEGNSYRCANKHCYDVAKSKYINLLLNPDKATTNPGDSKDSLLARNTFLNGKYYDGIARSVIEEIKKHQDDEPLQILDLGCGEGYYTQTIKEALGDTHTYYGLDISKEAIHMATKYTKQIYWIVGNSKNIPIMNHSLSFVVALFTVVNQQELMRVTKENGYIIHVTANAKHLVEIKELIYDEIHVKSDKYIRLDLPVIDSYDYIEKVSIPNAKDALSLLKMTPHYYHIKSEKRHIVDTIGNLDVTIDIKITVYQNQPI